ncbi:MAG: hypothetical protein IPN90_11760 [Elusimicrobia bacterium]|nr:hypothetical protein [Elusimicrobiota bacterium]
MEIALGGLDGSVAEPVFDDVEVDPGLQEMDGGSMPERVRGDFPFCEGRALYGGAVDVFFDEERTPKRVKVPRVD